MRVMIFDCETGGFNAAEDRLLTIAMVPVVAGTVEEGREWKVRSPGRVSAEALAVNGIDLAAHDAEAWIPVDVVRGMQDFFGRYFTQREWVELGGHNQAFDMPFLRELWRMGSAAPFSKRFSSRSRCTMTLAQWLKDSGAVAFRDCKLASLAAFYGVELKDAHGALADATATAHVFVHMHEALRRAFAASALARESMGQP